MNNTRILCSCWASPAIINRDSIHFQKWLCIRLVARVVTSIAWVRTPDLAAHSISIHTFDFGFSSVFLSTNSNYNFLVFACSNRSNARQLLIHDQTLNTRHYTHTHSHHVQHRMRPPHRYNVQNHRNLMCQNETETIELNTHGRSQLKWRERNTQKLK